MGHPISMLSIQIDTKSLGFNHILGFYLFSINLNAQDMSRMTHFDLAFVSGKVGEDTSTFIKCSRLEYTLE